MPYLDHAASTALRPEARAAMDEVRAVGAANPTGAHAASRAARAVLEAARAGLAEAVGLPKLVFTSGGTESDNLAVIGGMAARAGRTRVVVSAVEHPAVLEAAGMLAGRGAEVCVVSVDGRGVVDLDALADVLGPDVGVVSVMASNNETGVVQPLVEVAALARERAPGALVHSDAVQSFGKVPFDAGELGLDAVSVTAHKLGGPIGVGALALVDTSTVAPILFGGHAEHDLRPGTPNAAGAAGFAAAVRAALDTRAPEAARLSRLRDRLESSLRERIDGLTVHGEGADRLPTHCHVGIQGVEADLLVAACDRAGLSVSSGSSCASGAQEPSHVLAAMGASGEGALRLSLGWTTSEADVDEAAGVVIEAVGRLRGRGRA